MTKDKRNISNIALRLLDWFSKNARDLPWRRTQAPYAIWVSEIMLQQTQVKTVIPYWERWMRALPSIADLAAAESETLHKLWEGLGYYTRVRNLQKAAQLIMADFSGTFPHDYDAILSLPGIGRYTAGAISSIAFNQPQPILDGNVIRVLTRLFGITANARERKTNERLWDIARRLVHAAAQQRAPSDASSVSHLNQSLMELGALVCTPKQPQCPRCPLQKQCNAQRTNRIEKSPNLGPRVVATKRRFVAFAIENRGKFFVRQRAAGQVNAHLWEFPNVEVFSDFVPAVLAQKHFGMQMKGLDELCTLRHTITRYRIISQVFCGILERSPFPASDSPFKLLSLAQLKALPFSSAHRKIIDRLQLRASKT